MEEEENKIQVALAFVALALENSQEGEPGGDDTNTWSTEVGPEVEPLPEPAPARSHSKSRS